MARLNNLIDSDEELPDISNLLPSRTDNVGEQPEPKCRISRGNSGTLSSREQRPLKLAHINSLLLPLTNEFRREKSTSLFLEGGTLRNEDEGIRPGCRWSGPSNVHHHGRRMSPRKRAQQSAPSTEVFLEPRMCASVLEEESECEDNLSDFIVDDTASESDAPPGCLPRRKNKNPREEQSSLVKGASSGGRVVDLTSPRKVMTQDERPETPPPGPSFEYWSDDCNGQLRL